MADNTTVHEQTVLWTKITMAVSLGIPFFLLLFSKVYPENSPMSKKFLVTVSLPYIFVNYISLFGGGVIKDAVVVNNVTEVEFGDLSLFYAIFFLITTVSSLAIIAYKFITRHGNEKQKLSYLLFGLTLTLMAGTLTNLIMPVFFNIFSLTPFGPLTTGFFIYFTTYAILKHQLFDIRVVIRKILVYSVLLAIIFATYSIFVSLVAFDPFGSLFVVG